MYRSMQSLLETLEKYDSSCKVVSHEKWRITGADSKWWILEYCGDEIVSCTNGYIRTTPAYQHLAISKQVSILYTILDWNKELKLFNDDEMILCKTRTFDCNSGIGRCPSDCRYRKSSKCCSKCLTCGSTLYLTDSGRIWCDNCGYIRSAEEKVVLNIKQWMCDVEKDNGSWLSIDNMDVNDHIYWAYSHVCEDDRNRKSWWRKLGLTEAMLYNLSSDYSISWKNENKDDIDWCLNRYNEFLNAIRQSEKDYSLINKNILSNEDPCVIAGLYLNRFKGKANDEWEDHSECHRGYETYEVVDSLLKRICRSSDVEQDINHTRFMVQMSLDDVTARTEIMDDVQLCEYIGNPYRRESFDIWDVTEFGKVYHCHYLGEQKGDLVEVVRDCDNKMVMSLYYV